MLHSQHISFSILGRFAFLQMRKKIIYANFHFRSSQLFALISALTPKQRKKINGKVKFFEYDTTKGSGYYTKHHLLLPVSSDWHYLTDFLFPLSCPRCFDNEHPEINF